MTKFQESVQNIPDRVLADTFGTNLPTVKGWKTGRYEPRSLMMKAISDKVEALRKQYEDTDND